VANRGRSSNSQPDDEDDEDDLETTRVRISTKCPLTLQELNNPISSRKCPHVFDKLSIEQFIRESRINSNNNRRQGQQIGNPNCPVAGCREKIGLGDLFVDVTMVKKIKKLQEMKRREEEEEGESGEEVNEDLEFEDV
jgi:SUMO ligase MMS21 Smc5/6 complex component